MVLYTWGAADARFWYLPAGTIQIGQWYDFASVIDRTNGTVRAFLNGTEVLSTTIRTAPAIGAENSLYIGNRTTGLDGFIGVIDDVAIWNTARSSVDISADFSSGVDDTSAGLCAHWRFNERSGDEALDATSNRNNG